MTEYLDMQLKEFSDELIRIKNLIDFIELNREFGSIELSDKTNQDDYYSQFSMKIHERAGALSTDMRILSGTILLYTVGRFEHFVKKSFESLSDAIAEKCKTFDDLPKNMKSNLITQTAFIMTKQNQNRFESEEIQTFIENLSKNFKASDGIGQINSACLSRTDRNMKPNVLADLYKRVEINKLWDEIGKQSKLKIFFGSKNDGLVIKGSRNMLEEIMNIRNQIAHPPSNPIIPDASRISQFIDFLNLLSEVLADICKVHLAEIPNKLK